MIAQSFFSGRERLCVVHRKPEHRLRGIGVTLHPTAVSSSARRQDCAAHASEEAELCKLAHFRTLAILLISRCPPSLEAIHAAKLKPTPSSGLRG